MEEFLDSFAVDSKKQDELLESFKRFSLNIISEKPQSNNCLDCDIPMYLERHLYICPKCGRTSTNNSELLSSEDVNHNINVSANGGVYVSNNSDNIDKNIRKKINNMNKKLSIPIHDELCELIFYLFKEIRQVNRGKIDSALLAHSSHIICSRFGVLIKEEDLINACDITQQKYNAAVKIFRSAELSGDLCTFFNKYKDNFDKIRNNNIVNIDEKIQSTIFELIKINMDIQIIKTVRQIMNCEFNSQVGPIKIDKYTTLACLYVLLHQYSSESSKYINSRIAGALWRINCKFNLGIYKEDMKAKTGVSISTFQDVSSELTKVLSSKIK